MCGSHFSLGFHLGHMSSCFHSHFEANVIAEMNHLSYPDASLDSHEDVMNLVHFLEKEKNINPSFQTIKLHLSQNKYYINRFKLSSILSIKSQSVVFCRILNYMHLTCYTPPCCTASNIRAIALTMKAVQTSAMLVNLTPVYTML